MKAQISSIRLEHILQIASPLDGAFLRLVLIGFVYSESHVYQVEDVVGVARSKAEWECGLHSYLYIVAMHVGMRSIHRIAVVVDSTYAGFAVEGEGETILQFPEPTTKKDICPHQRTERDLRADNSHCNRADSCERRLSSPYGHGRSCRPHCTWQRVLRMVVLQTVATEDNSACRL